MSVHHPYVILDVFTDVPLQGNPLAVFPDAQDIEGETMQRTARELNLSETVFLLPPGAGPDADAHARIFTPSTELPFAGHPILGAAFVVGERTARDAVALQTQAGLIRLRLERANARIVAGEMEQPLPTREPFQRAGDLLAALSVEGSALPIEAYTNGPTHVFVALPGPRQVAQLRPDLGALQRLGAVGVSCFALDGNQVKTRMFAPGLGVGEDPATGSAAGPLAAHLARHGWIEYGQRIEIRQGEEIGRPSLLKAEVHGSHERLERLVVGGRAVTVARGEYRLA